MQATPQLREGPRYQAMIPLWLALKPPGREQDDKRHGRLVTATEVLGVLPLEKIRADALPFDAVADAEFHRPDGVAPPACLAHDSTCTAMARTLLAFWIPIQSQAFP